MKKLKTRCKSLDELFGGGIEPGIITMIYGESGTGKTNFCLQLSKEIGEGKKVAYIDSEGVSLERLHQICGDKYKKLVDNILFFKPNSMEDQEKSIKNIKKIKNPGLLVIDTINLFYRMKLEDDKEAAMRSFLRQMGTLQMIAREKNIPVIVIQQVYTDKQGEIKPFTHRETDHMVKTLVRFDKVDIGIRSATIMKHRSQAEGKSTIFKITSCGLE